MFFHVLLLVFASITIAHVKTNNWAVLINTSAYWFNYRHASNILGIYQQLKSRGIPDSNIILMVAEDVACNSRNVFPGTVVNNELKRENLVDGEVEIDYRGAEVSVDNLIRLFTDRNSENVTKNKLLMTDENSNILIYMTGHGGDNFMKFRNVEEVNSQDLSAAFEMMWQQKRYKEILFMVDTCQAASLLPLLTAPNIFGIASSKVGESSYSYTVDSEIGLSVIDRFSHKFYEFLKEATSESSIQDFLSILDPNFLGSTPISRGDLFSRSADQIRIFDFVKAGKKEVDLGKIEHCNKIYTKRHSEKIVHEDTKRKDSDFIYNINFESDGLLLKVIGSLTIFSCLFFLFFKSIL